MKTWTVYNYFDVWGNKMDGYVVNNQCVEMDDLYIDEGATKKEICGYLVAAGLLKTSDMRRLEVVDWGNYIEINAKKGGMPLFGIMMNEV